MNAITLPSQDTTADRYRQEALEVLQALRTEPLVVDSDRAAESVGQAIAECALQKRELETLLKAITKPINDGLKQARALFKPAIDALDQVERELRKPLAAYRLAQHNAVAAARERALKAAEAGDTEALHAALAVPDPKAGDSATTTRFRWVVDHVDEANMPRDWMTADMNKLNTLCRLTSGQDEIEAVPGVTFRREATVVRR